MLNGLKQYFSAPAAVDDKLLLRLYELEYWSCLENVPFLGLRSKALAKNAKYPLMRYNPFWRLKEEETIKERFSDNKIHYELAEGFNTSFYLLVVAVILVFFSVAQAIATRTSGIFESCNLQHSNICRPYNNFNGSLSDLSHANNDQIPTFTSRFVDDPTGYLTVDGRIGYCEIGYYVDTTFAHSNLGLAIAWGVSSIVILAFSYAWSMFISSGALRVLQREIKQNRAFLRNATTDWYYSMNKFTIGFLLFIVFCGAIILPVLAATIPLIFFKADNCPYPAATNFPVFVFYNLATNAIRNNLILTVLSIIWSTLQFVFAVRALLLKIENPIEVAHPTTVLKNSHLVSYFARNNQYPPSAINIKANEVADASMGQSYLPEAIEQLSPGGTEAGEKSWEYELLEDSNYEWRNNAFLSWNTFKRALARLYMVCLCAVPICAFWVPIIIAVFIVN